VVVVVVIVVVVVEVVTMVLTIAIVVVAVVVSVTSVVVVVFAIVVVVSVVSVVVVVFVVVEVVALTIVVVTAIVFVCVSSLGVVVEDVVVVVTVVVVVVIEVIVGSFVVIVEVVSIVVVVLLLVVDWTHIVVVSMFKSGVSSIIDSVGANAWFNIALKSSTFTAGAFVIAIDVVLALGSNVSNPLTARTIAASPSPAEFLAVIAYFMVEDDTSAATIPSMTPFAALSCNPFGNGGWMVNEVSRPNITCGIIFTASPGAICFGTLGYEIVGTSISKFILHGA